MANTIRMFSGVLVDLVNPDPADVLISDIAHHLSLINRYTGGTKHGFSVAHHSLEVASKTQCLEGLMHDAHEAYIGDVSSPLKQHLTEYKRIETMWEQLIIDKFNLDPARLLSVVKPVDTNIRVPEVFGYMGRHGCKTPEPRDVELEFLQMFDYYSHRKVKNVGG